MTSERVVGEMEERIPLDGRSLSGTRDGGWKEVEVEGGVETDFEISQHGPGS